MLIKEKKYTKILINKAGFSTCAKPVLMPLSIDECFLNVLYLNYVAKPLGFCFILYGKNRK